MTDEKTQSRSRWLEWFAEGVPAGRLFGVEIRLHLLLAIPLLYFWAELRDGGAPLGARFFVWVVFSVALFGSVLAHELGHCRGARRVGGEARRILLWPLGGLALVGGVEKGPRQEFVVTILGPAVNVALALLFAALAYAMPASWSDARWSAAMARDLIANIPRLEPIAEIVYYQEKRYDGSGIPEDSAAGERIPLGARILKLALDYDALSPSGVFSPEAFSALERRSGWYDPALLKTFHKTLRERADGELKSLVTHDMEKSVRSSVQVLMDVLSLANPTASARASRILRIAHMICQELQAPNAWQIDVAAMLSQVGCVSTPEDILAKAYRGETLSEEETRVFQTHPRVGRDLIARIPRLEPVAKIVEYQGKHFDGLGVPLDEIAGERIPLGARVLKLALDYDTLAPSGTFQADAFEKIERREGWYDPAVVRALRRALRAKGRYELAELRPAEMNVDMIVGEDVRDAEGRLLVAKGQELTSALLSFLRGYSGHPTVNRRIQTLVPIEAKRIEGR